MLMKTAPVIDDAALKQVAVQKWQDGRCDAHDDAIAVEVPVALEYNGISHAVMLASPADLEDFAHSAFRSVKASSARHRNCWTARCRK